MLVYRRNCFATSDVKVVVNTPDRNKKKTVLEYCHILSDIKYENRLK